MADAENQVSLEYFESELRAVRAAIAVLRGHVTGAELHQIMLGAAPNLNIRAIVGMPTGPGALTKFVDTYLSDQLRRAGSKGGDVLYELEGSSVASALTAGPNIWKAFVSPNSSSYLYFKKSTNGLFLTQSLVDEMGAYLIEKISGVEHQAVREQFIAEISEEIPTSIDLNVVKDSSYEQFLTTLRRHSLARRWGLFRLEKFRELFTQRLSNLGVSEETVQVLVEELILSQELVHKSSEKPVSSNVARAKATKSSPPNEIALEAARSLARAAIEHLSYDDLRAIHIPLGAVLDALSAQK